MRNIDPGMRDMLDTFILETENMLEQLDEIMLESERSKSLSEESIASIFRITHTIKGSAAMMGFDEISNLSHAVEDVFYILRDDSKKLSIIFDSIFDLVFKASDFLKNEIDNLTDEDSTPGDPSQLINALHSQADILKGESAQKTAEPLANIPVQLSVLPQEGQYSIQIFFEDGCQMENMRAFMIMTQLQQCCSYLSSIPDHPENNSAYSDDIIKNGFVVICNPAKSIEEVEATLERALNIKSYEITCCTQKSKEIAFDNSSSKSESSVAEPSKPAAKSVKQSLISVNQTKLDQLMDLVGEIVTAESMVSRNPDLRNLKLESFNKSARELKKLTDELQDIVMSIRMVPLNGTFHKMDRIVRDMSKKLGKEAELTVSGGDTEVDKTINDAIVDPLMHMVRNSMDHAIETPEERKKLGKPEVGKITLSARNVGGEILIEVKDDGAGLDAKKLLSKAAKSGILIKPENEYSEKEAFSLIMAVGFSTNTEVTEFSGRGVGMDVVKKNIEQVGGTISISSEKNKGTTFTIKIPLTLAILDGMNISVGNTIFTMPIASINQTFKISDQNQIITNANGGEMIMIRGDCYPVIRLNKLYNLDGGYEDITKGIMIQIESTDGNACLFADELIGEYQVVVKPFPAYFGKYNLKGHGLSGCSILGDGTISLILDANTLLSEN